MATQRPSSILLVVLVVVVIAVAGAAAALVYEYNKPKATSPVLTVSEGSNVTVNYIGEFGSGPQTGRVFDTSIFSVSANNQSYPKSLEYQPRGPVTAYTPLGVHVGPNAPASGYTLGNLTFNTVVPGFWQGLIGLAGNQTRTIVVPPDLGYGPLNTSCVATSSLVYTVPRLTYVSLKQFGVLYPGVDEVVGQNFTDPTYEWNDTIFAVNSTTIAVLAEPTLWETTHPNGLPFAVTSLNATSITLSSRLTTSDAGLVLGQLTSGSVCGKTKFIVNAVNPAAGTFTENFNSEVQGETLDFTVTVVDIFPA
jgi:FKBP-type peptidyl-prolyl cis-trans isomerase 2